MGHYDDHRDEIYAQQRASEATRKKKNYEADLDILSTLSLDGRNLLDDLLRLVQDRYKAKLYEIQGD